MVVICSNRYEILNLLQKATIYWFVCQVFYGHQNAPKQAPQVKAVATHPRNAFIDPSIVQISQHMVCTQIRNSSMGRRLPRIGMCSGYLHSKPSFTILN